MLKTSLNDCVKEFPISDSDLDRFVLNALMIQSGAPTAPYKEPKAKVLGPLIEKQARLQQSVGAIKMQLDSSTLSPAQEQILQKIKQGYESELADIKKKCDLESTMSNANQNHLKKARKQLNAIKERMSPTQGFPFPEEGSIENLLLSLLTLSSNHFSFVDVKPGTFMMGDRANRESALLHQVTLTKPFGIQTSEVTQQLYEEITGKNPSKFRDPNRPVERVSFKDVQKFIDGLNEKRKKLGDRCTYRLPTEAEWEYAARGGNEIPDYAMQAAYSFGDNAQQLGEFAIFGNHSGNQTSVVASKKPNPLGLFDIHGNVSEWVQDTYQDGDIFHRPTTDPLIDLGAGERLVRGGSFRSSADGDGLRSHFRIMVPPNYSEESMGFRLVRECPKIH